MGWNNPPVRWKDLERALSGKPVEQKPDGGDGPGWSQAPRPVHRAAGARAARGRPRQPQARAVRGAALPLQLQLPRRREPPRGTGRGRARQLGLDAIAITDHDGMYGVVRFAEAAKELGVHTVFGAELSIGLPSPQNGESPTRRASTCFCLPPDRTATTGSAARSPPVTSTTTREKGRPVYDLDQVVADTRARSWCSPAAAREPCAARCTREGPDAAFEELRRAHRRVRPGHASTSS